MKESQNFQIGDLVKLNDTEFGSNVISANKWENSLGIVAGIYADGVYIRVRWWISKGARIEIYEESVSDLEKV